MKMKNTFLFATLVFLILICKSSAQQNTNTIMSANAPNSPSQRNVLIGKFAGDELTSQPNGVNGDNVFVGFEAGTNSNSYFGFGECSRNTFLGSFSGQNNTRGSDNVFLGFGAGQFYTTGDQNVFIKSIRETINTTGIPMTGDGNTMVGFQTGDFMQMGTHNSFFGHGAGRRNTDGNYNLFLGHNAGSGNLTGNQNISLGIGANQENSIGDGDNNIYIGSYAAQVNNGSRNTIVGYLSGQNLVSGIANTFLGFVKVPTTSTSILSAGFNLKSSIVLADGNGNQRLFVSQQGNTGIALGNDVIPANRLDVGGGVVIGRNYTPRLLPNPVEGAIAPSNGLLVEGKVGVGTISPNNKVEITEGTVGKSGLRFTNLTSSFNPISTQPTTKFLSVNATGDVVLQNLPSLVSSNELTSQNNTMTSTMNSLISNAPIVNSISNSLTNTNELITTVNGVSSAPILLPIPNFSEIDGSITNELQTLTQSGNIVTLSNGGGSFTLPVFTDTDAQSLTLNGNNLSISNGNTVVLPTYTDTDGQSLTLNGNNLSISNGNTVVLPAYVDTDTDGQSLSLNGNNLSISNGNTVVLPTFVEIDGSITNELQTLTQSGNVITLSNGGGSFTLPTFTDTDAQSLTLVGNNLTISNGNTVVLPTYTDTDTDEQSLTLNGNNLTISNGNTVVLPTYTDTDAQSLTLNGNNLTISNGNTVALPTTSVTAGNNITVTGNGTTTPFLISSVDTSLYANNGSINTATTVNYNRIVDMNNRNIWFNTSTSTAHGKIYIGNTTSYPTTTGNYKLFVEGGILTEKVKVALRSTSNWADYVFANDYKLMPLSEVEQFISTNKHLPGVASASDLVKDGIDVVEMQSKQMEKIEELTLYVIQQNKKIEELQKQVQALIEKTN